ncbi:MAG: hypothetical protein HPY75_11160, partial [Actinobacteria bacterium]|nr:hypothetical protein [Actinomycetota bacterium]
MGNSDRNAKLARLLALLAAAILCMGVLAPLGARPPLGEEAASADADPYEPNDTIEQAYGPLSLGSYEALIYPEGDSDFYSIDVPSRCRALRITLTSIPESCDYDLRLYDAAGEQIDGSGNENNQDKRIDRANPAQGRYYIEVMSYETYSESDTYVLGVGRSDLVTDRVWEKVGPSGISPPLVDYSVAQVEACGQDVAYAVLDPEASADGKVLKTTDYGENWEVLDLAHPNPDYKFDWTQHISVVDDQTVWVGSVSCPEYMVARTTDGGESWSYHGGSAYMYALEATSSLEAWLGGYYQPAGFILHTVDGGFSWGDPEFASNWYTILDIHQQGGDAWAVGTHNYSGRVLHRVFDEGEGEWGWAEVALPSGVPQELLGCWTLEEGGQRVVWAVGGDAILKSLDGGGNWSLYRAPVGAGYLRAVCALDSSTAFAAGDGGTILRTTDGGENWDFMYNISSEKLTSIYAVDADHAWASGDNGTLLRLVQYNTRVGSDVTVDLGGGDSITFASVTAPGNTIKTSAPNPTGEEFNHHFPLKCVDISTSASFSGTFEVRFPYGDSIWDDRAFHMLHNTGSGWEDITTGVDTENNIITGQATSLSEFVVIFPIPKINSIDPSWGLRGNSVDAEITGYGFWEAPSDKPYIALQREGQADIEATDVVVHSLYRITCSFPLPAGALPDIWNVYIMNPDEMYEDTLPNSFRVMDPMPLPTVTSTSPGYAQRGTENVLIDIYGTGFWEAFPAYPTAWLSREGEPDITGTLYTFYDSTHAKYEFDLPADVYSGPWDVNVKNPDGKAGKLPGGFMITGGLPAPTLTSVNPNAGSSGATVDVTVGGTGFWGTPFICLRHANEGQGVAYNPIWATDIAVQSPTSVTCKFPLYANRAPGAWNVFIRNQDNQEATLVGGFTVTAANPPPTVTGITPNSGAQGSTVSVTNLAGTGFYGTPTVKLKKAGQTDITATGVVVQSPNKITCSLPIPSGAATGAWDVWVKNPDNQEATLAGGFTVTAGGGGGNTPQGTDVEVDLGGGVEVGFESVSGGGETTATPLPDPSVANFHILGGSCYDITTTATFTGTILVTLPYDEGALTVPESSLRLLHLEGGSWVDVTSSQDTDANTITGEVDSLSPFAIGWAAADTWYLAEGCTQGGMKTWVLVQNPNPDPVKVDLTFMTSQGKV